MTTSDFRSYELAKQHYKLCKNLRVPKFLHEQLMKASSSVALNLAEGSGKKTEKDQKNFFSIALGSLYECRAILEIESYENTEVMQINRQLGGMIYVLSRGQRLTLNREPSAGD